MIDPIELKDPFFRDMTNADYNLYMNGFHRVVGQDLMFDSSKTNLSDVLRLPATLHRKNKRKVQDDNNTYITIPCAITKVSYDERNPDWIEREHVIELWNPFEVTVAKMKYAKKGRVKKVFTQIKQWLEDPECIKKINWYRNETNTKKYKELRWEKQLSISEKEIWRCCNEWRLDRWKVITNLPGWHIDFWNWYGALKFRNNQGVLENTSWYKFKRLWLIPEEDIKKIETWDTFFTEDGMECNYCGWYINDWFSKHNRPAGPMLNFVYMYMQQCVCDKGARVSDIYEQVRKFFKKICPKIKDDLLSNYQPANPENRVFGKPNCFIECTDDAVTLTFDRQTPTGKIVPMESWLVVFNQPVNIIGRAFLQNEWTRFISNTEQETVQSYTNEEWSYKENKNNYVVKYLLEVNKKTFGISNCSTALQLEKQLNKINAGIHFIGNDELCRRFFSALDFASDTSLPTHEQYGLKTIYGNQGSRYWINNNSGKPFCVIGDTAICGDAPEILEWIDSTAKDIIDFNLKDVTISEYRKHIKELWELKVYGKIFISSWSCQFMNIAENAMNSGIGITLWPNVNIYGGSETGKSSLRYAIQSSFWYKMWKKYLSMQMTTPQPLIDSMSDWACMLYEEMTSKVESDQKKQEAKEIVIRGAANKETKMTWWVQAKREVKMRSCNIYFGESSIKDDSANNRVIKIKLTKKVRNPDKKQWEAALCWLQNHTVKNDLYPAIMKWYEQEDHLFSKLKEYKALIAKEIGNERLWDLESYGMVLFVDTFHLWTIKDFLEMIRYNLENDVSNVRDTSMADPITQIESLVSWIIFRAKTEKSCITSAAFDEFPNSIYNHHGATNQTEVVKIDLSTIKTNITNYDNDVEKVNEIMPGFIKTTDQCIYICAYGTEIIDKLEVWIGEWLIEWIDLQLFKEINEKIKIIINLMKNGKKYNDWYDYNTVTQNNVCDEQYWRIIRKVFYSTNVLL